MTEIYIIKYENIDVILHMRLINFFEYVIFLLPTILLFITQYNFVFLTDFIKIILDQQL